MTEVDLRPLPDEVAICRELVGDLQSAISCLRARDREIIRLVLDGTSVAAPRYRASSSRLKRVMSLLHRTARGDIPDLLERLRRDAQEMDFVFEARSAERKEMRAAAQDASERERLETWLKKRCPDYKGSRGYRVGKKWIECADARMTSNGRYTSLYDLLFLEAGFQSPPSVWGRQPYTIQALARWREINDEQVLVVTKIAWQTIKMRLRIRSS